MNPKNINFENLYFHFKVAQKVYSTSCSSTSECKSSHSLYCSVTGNLCQCPQNLGVGTCDCIPTQYFGASGCGKLFNYLFDLFLLNYLFLILFYQVNRVSQNGGCSATYMCISGLNLVCNGTNCVCISGYYWNGTICRKFYFHFEMMNW